MKSRDGSINDLPINAAAILVSSPTPACESNCLCLFVF